MLAADLSCTRKSIVSCINYWKMESIRIQITDTLYIKPEPFGFRPKFSSGHTGYLEKRGQIVKSWRKRYFVLKDNILSYYTDATLTNRKGFVVLDERCSVEMLLERVESHGNLLSLRTPKASYLLSASTSTDKLQWLNAFKEAISLGFATVLMPDVHPEKFKVSALLEACWLSAKDSAGKDQADVKMQDGNILHPSLLQSRPQISVTFKDTPRSLDSYALVMVDLDCPSRHTPSMSPYILHLVVNITPPQRASDGGRISSLESTSSTSTVGGEDWVIEEGNGEEWIPYEPPWSNPGCGLHRVLLLLYKQPSLLLPPIPLKAGRKRVSFPELCTALHLSGPPQGIEGMYVQEGAVCGNPTPSPALNIKYIHTLPEDWSGALDKSVCVAKEPGASVAQGLHVDTGNDAAGLMSKESSAGSGVTIEEEADEEQGISSSGGRLWSPTPYERRNSLTAVQDEELEDAPADAAHALGLVRPPLLVSTAVTHAHTASGSHATHTVHIPSPRHVSPRHSHPPSVSFRLQQETARDEEREDREEQLGNTHTKEERKEKEGSLEILIPALSHPQTQSSNTSSSLNTPTPTPTPTPVKSALKKTSTYSPSLLSLPAYGLAGSGPATALGRAPAGGLLANTLFNSSLRIMPTTPSPPKLSTPTMSQALPLPYNTHIATTHSTSMNISPLTSPPMSASSMRRKTVSFLLPLAEIDEKDDNRQKDADFEYGGVYEDYGGGWGDSDPYLDFQSPELPTPAPAVQVHKPPHIQTNNTQTQTRPHPVIRDNSDSLSGRESYGSAVSRDSYIEVYNSPVSIQSIRNLGGRSTKKKEQEVVEQGDHVTFFPPSPQSNAADRGFEASSPASPHSSPPGSPKQQQPQQQQQQQQHDGVAYALDQVCSLFRERRLKDLQDLMQLPCGSVFSPAVHRKKHSEDMFFKPSLLWIDLEAFCIIWTKVEEDKKAGKRASLKSGESKKLKCLPFPRPAQLTVALPPLPGESRGEVRGVGRESGGGLIIHLSPPPLSFRITFSREDDRTAWERVIDGVVKLCSQTA